jgi:hypothetical protein
MHPFVARSATVAIAVWNGGAETKMSLLSARDWLEMRPAPISKKFE